MSTLFVNNLNTASGSNITLGSGKTLDTSGGTLKPSAGQIVQYQSRNVLTNGFNTTSSTFVDVTDYYVDITPTSATNLLVFHATIWHQPSATSGAYSRWQIVDSNNSDTKWHALNFVGSAGYLSTSWQNLTIAHTRTATTTSTMRLQLQVRVTGGGTCQMNWSGNENRTLQVTEIAQ